MLGWWIPTDWPEGAAGSPTAQGTERGTAAGAFCRRLDDARQFFRAGVSAGLNVDLEAAGGEETRGEKDKRKESKHKKACCTKDNGKEAAVEAAD